jgi:hypothetical protein
MIQPLFEIVSQRVSPDRLNGTIHFVGEIIFASAGGLANVFPVGSLVAGSRKSFCVNERLDEIDPVVVQQLPVVAYPVGNSGQYM